MIHLIPLLRRLPSFFCSVVDAKNLRLSLSNDITTILLLLCMLPPNANATDALQELPLPHCYSCLIASKVASNHITKPTAPKACYDVRIYEASPQQPPRLPPTKPGGYHRRCTGTFDESRNEGRRTIYTITPLIVHIYYTPGTVPEVDVHDQDQQKLGSSVIQCTVSKRVPKS